MEEVEKFCAMMHLDAPSLSEDKIAVIFLGESGSLHFDLSIDGRALTYIFTECERLTTERIFRAMQSCDPSRLVGYAMNLVADESGRVGFLIDLPACDCHAAAFTQAFNQLLQAQTQLLHV
jgi:hypothetical protein